MHSEAMATRDTVGAMQQVWVCPNNTPRSRLARFLRLSALHATTPPPCNLLFPKCSIRAHMQHFGTCSCSVPALVCLCVEQVVTLTLFGCRALMECGAAKRLWWEHPGCLSCKGKVHTSLPISSPSYFRFFSRGFCPLILNLGNN